MVIATQNLRKAEALGFSLLKDGGDSRDRGPRNDREPRNDRGLRNDRDRRSMSSSMDGGGQGGGFSNTYGLSTQFLENLGIDGPLHTR